MPESNTDLKPPSFDGQPQNTQKERRSLTRPGDNEFYAIAQAAITVAKGEIDPEQFRRTKNAFNRYQRVAGLQLSAGKITQEQYNESLAEYHAATNVADSFDELTGVFDRETIKRMVDRELSSPVQEGKTHVYIDMDINGLKAHNEQSLRKHLSADEALKGFASFHMKKLYEVFGYRARMGRLSGDEFAVIITNTTIDDVKTFFNEIEPEREGSMKKIKEAEGLPSDITAMRAIVAALPGDTHSAIHERADQLLIEQKQDRNLKRLQEISS